MNWTSGATKALIVSVVGVTLSAGLALAVDGGTSQPAVTVDTAVGAAEQTPERVAAADPALVRAFAVLRKKRSAADRLPDQAAGRAGASGDGQNAALARLAMTRSGHSWFIVPSAQGVCATDEMGGGGCTATGDAVAGAFVGVDVCAPALSDDKVRVYGLVPDAGSVQLEMADGSRVSPTVVNNFYSEEFSKSSTLPARVLWTAGDSQMHSRNLPLRGADAHSCG